MGGQQIDIVANLLMKVDSAEAGINKLKNSLSKLTLPKNLEANFRKSFANLDTIFARYRSQVEKGFTTKGEVSAFAKTGKQLDAELERISKHFAELTGKQVDFKVKDEALIKAEKELQDIIDKKNQLVQNTLQLKIDNSSVDSVKTLLETLRTIAGDTKAGRAVGNALAGLESGNIQQTINALNQAAEACKRLGDTKKTTFEQKTGISMGDAITALLGILKQTESEFDGFNSKTKTAEENVQRITGDNLQRVNNYINQATQSWEQQSGAVRKVNGEMQEYARASQSMTEQLGALKTSTQYFFGLRNMINLLKRGIRETVEVVKDLDKAMTETAVVTKFDVSDMWAKLPEYTANANALGATVLDMYKSTTLYYQQGLNTQQAMEIATETMKMARIAGMEAADATDMMTAALRGFNMEINEASAEHINDVYSNLAAKTASNTEELGTAMQRTASIAASAGMSFEGTAAFLAQAIETTREPAENLGTAMKTIVARFTELKKNPLEITEVDGEEVSYNKVDTALQSIGVSLKDANGQFRDLDKVFLDISQRWDSLTQTQQRYIATTAAGSRQQSRFIAMMSNYERTMQLMDYANNSAGASQEQFGKTLESLEAKLNKFQNAWKEFLMGIMDNSWIKFLVDSGTKALGVVNKLIDTLSGGGKLKSIKSFLSIFTAFSALKLAGRGINRLIGGMGGMVDPTSTFRKGFWGVGTAGQTTGVVGKITTPIVQKLNELISVTKTAYNLKTNNNPQTTSTVAQYQAVSSLLRTVTSTTIGEVSKRFNNLSDEHAYMAYRTSPGTINAMQQSALGWLNSQSLSDEGQKVGQQLMNNIFRGMKKGEIPVKEGMKLIGKPALWGKYFGTDVAKEFSNQYVQMLKSQSSVVKANTNKAHEMALSAMGYDKNNESQAKFFTGSSKEFKTLMSNKNMRDAYVQYFRQFQDELNGSIDKTPVLQKKFDIFGNTVANFGSKFTSAGYSIQMFGSQLAQLSPALQGVGALIAKVGGLITTLGYGFSGVGKIISSVGSRITAATEAYNLVRYGDAIGAGINSGAIMKDAVAPIAKTGAAAGKAARQAFVKGFSPAMLASIYVAAIVGGLMLIHNKIEKKTQEEGQKVRDAFEKGFTENEKKLESISSSKDRFQELSKGVDGFGNNVNLTNEQYEEYLNLSKELAEITPSLIAGYNAEGEAILKTGAALDEAIVKLEKYKQDALEAYTANEAINKLVQDFQTSDAYKTYGSKKGRVSYYGGTSINSFSKSKSNLKTANAKISSGFNVIDAINQLGGGSIDGPITSLDNLSTAQLTWVAQHYNDIINLVKENNQELDEEVIRGLEEAFSGIAGKIDEVTTEGQPIIDALQKWMGTEGIDAVGIGLGEEFINAFTQGFDTLMVEGLTEGWSSEQFKSALQDYSAEWKKLAGETSEYTQVLSEADEIQENYLEHVGETGALEEYKNSIEDSAIALEDLAEKHRDGSAAGEAFAQHCYEQAAAMRHYAEEGKTLGQALNEATDNISAAESAVEDFNTATEKDFWSVAEDMKGIYDKAIETFKDSSETELEKHFEGKGDKTAWEAGKTLFGEKALEGLDANALRKKFKEWEPALREGEEGWVNFWKKVTGDEQIQKNLKDLEQYGVTLDKNGFLSHVPDDQWGRVAEAIGISEELLTALVNKGRQFADISFANWEEVRHTLETSDYAIKGQNVQKNGKSNIYMRKESFETALSEDGYLPSEYAQQEKYAREKQNIELIDLESSSKKLKKQFKDMGLKTLPEFVKTLAKTGDWTKDEIQELAEKGGFDTTGYDETYDSIISALENPELEKQTSELESISGKLDTIINKKTGEEARDYAKEVHGALVGKKGVIDTDAQAFAHGKKIVRDADNNIIYDESGKPVLENLTTEEYAATKESIDHMAEVYESEAAAAYEQMLRSSGVEREYFKEAYETSTENAKIARGYSAAGEKNFDEIQKANKELQGRTSAENQAGVKNAEKNIAEREKSEEERDAKLAKIRKDKDDAITAAYEAKKEKELKDFEEENKKQEKIQKDKNDAIAAAQKANKEREEKERERLEGRARAERESNRATINKSTEEDDLFKQGYIRQHGLVAWKEREEQADIQSKIDFLSSQEASSLTQNLRDAIGNLDAKKIANDAGQKQALINLYSDIIKNSQPDSSDLNALNLLSNAAYAGGAVTEKQKEQVSNFIDSIGTTFQTWRDKINGIDTTLPKLPTNLPTDTGNSVTNAQNGRQNAINSSINANNEVNVKATAETEEASNKLGDFGQDFIDLQTLVAPGINFNIQANNTGANLGQISKDVEKITAASSKTNVVKTEAGEVDTSKVKEGIQKIGGMEAKLPVKAEDATAEGLRKIKNKISTTHATMKVKVTSEGQTNFSVTVHRSGAKGLNNFIPHSPLPIFGSLAKGTKSRYGQVGPQNKGGLTLTGEKGYEIAWLPSENRSMILGAGGPQMINLPSDAVVYTHEQSKDIMRRKSIPAGSHADISYDPSNSRYVQGGGSSASKSIVNNAKKAGDKVSKTAEDTKKGIERVLVWWDNAGRRADAIQRRADANQKTYEKYLEEIQSTLKTTGTIGKGNAYLTDMQKLITEQQRQYNKATKELKQLDTGKDANGKKVKANKTNYKKGADNVVQISYDAGSGKKKKTKTAYINTAGYIKYDSASGAYQVDQSALDKVKNESQRKAIADAVKKELDDRISKRNKAEDEMQEVEEAIEKMGEELYNTFFKWETELTKIWNITQKIEATEARIGRAKGYSELLTSQLSTGLAKAGKDFAENSLNAFKTGIDNQRKQIEQTLESVGEKRNNLSRLLSLDDEKDTLDNIQKKLSDDVRADYNIKKAEAAEAKAKAALDKAQNQTKTTTTPNKKITKISRTLKKGSKGSDVKDLQKALNQALGTNLAIDGKFGSKTQAAVKKFQKKYGLSQTGKMDKKTLAKLANVTGTKKTTKVAGDPEVIAKAQEAYDKAVELTKSIKEGDLNETEKLGYETYAEALEKGINAQARAWDFLTVQRRGDGTIDLNFNTEAFEEAKQNGEISEELGKSIQDYVKELVDSNKDLNEEYEKVTSLMNDLYGELETLQDQWVGYANDLWDMSEAETKKRNDNAKKLNDSLTKALKDLLDDVKKKLDQRRQQEDNAKTERDISQKQQRLTALRADTSGGHQVEIAQLEKEIAEAQQNYQRTLEDQLLERLQEQADIAEQQRERQIELQETIAEAVNNAALVDMWMADPATFEQEIWEAYKAQNDYDKKPQALQEDLLNKFNVMFDGLLNNQDEQAYVQEQIEELQKQKDILDVIKENVETLATNAETESVSGGEGVEEGGTQELLTQVLNKLIEDDKPKTTSTTPAATNTPAKKTTNKLKYGKVSAVSGTLKKGSSGNGVKALQDALNKILGTKLAVDGKFGSKTFAAVKKFQKKYGLSQDGVVGSKTKAKFKALGYESGGLADYTGPAWLDGTPSKPELVLDATDTKNFLALRDVLSGAMKSADSINSSYGGDVTYEVNINVDHLNSDYDVDKVAERVKKIIVKDSSYRNVTQVRNFR